MKGISKLIFSLYHMGNAITQDCDTHKELKHIRCSTFKDCYSGPKSWKDGSYDNMRCPDDESCGAWETENGVKRRGCIASHYCGKEGLVKPKQELLFENVKCDIETLNMGIDNIDDCQKEALKNNCGAFTFPALNKSLGCRCCKTREKGISNVVWDMYRVDSGFYTTF
jgi:hypothetical protein